MSWIIVVFIYGALCLIFYILICSFYVGTSQYVKHKAHVYYIFHIYTVQCHYNMGNFLLNPHNRQPVACLSFCEINSSPLRASSMCQRIGSDLVQMMASNLFSTQPLSKPMWDYCQLDHCELTSVKFQSKYKTFHSRKCIWKYCLQNGSYFVLGEMI